MIQGQYKLSADSPNLNNWFGCHMDKKKVNVKEVEAVVRATYAGDYRRTY